MKKSAYLQIRLTEKEKDELFKQAEKRGFSSVAEYIRALIFKDKGAK